MQYINDDLIEIFLSDNSNIDILIHGCNCFNTMGLGFGKTLSNRIPEILKIDRNTIKGVRNKLGNYSFYKLPNTNKIIINGYTQYGFGRNTRFTDYNSIKELFIKINNNFKNKIIGIPKIGAGLGGGKWEIIEKIINDVTTNNTIIVFIYP